MSSNFYRIDGWPVARGTARAFLTRLKPAFEKAFPGITLHVNSGFRSYEDQKKIFLERYRVQWVGNGPYGDVRWWNGVRYVRHSGKGTVAQPGTSNHGTGAAIDIYDSGKDAGVTKFGSARDKWMQANAGKYGFSNREGNAVNEAWHKNATVSAWEGSPIPREISPTDPGMTLAELLGGPASTPEGDEDVVTAADIEKIAEATAKKTWMYRSAHNNLAFGDMLRNLFNARRWGKKGKWHHGDATAYEVQNLAAIRGEVAGLTEAVKQLAAGKDLDTAAITSAVTKAVEAGMKDVEITLSANG